MMISEQPGIWAKPWEREGLLQGQAALLLRMLERRFGTVLDNTARRVQAADKSSLEHWAMNLLEAATLDDVFRDRVLNTIAAAHHKARHIRKSGKISGVFDPLRTELDDIFEEGKRKGVFRKDSDWIDRYVSLSGLGF